MAFEKICSFNISKFNISPKINLNTNKIFLLVLFLGTSLFVLLYIQNSNYANAAPVSR